ncbi:2,3-bisphosphoglycerate-independent phosphoglycerate mutase [Legionella israelensis]|uniref:2,3-bisphosphoglycerate-independent phosphoglycerate mutase n=1 Tax=Legionella israelensis TaxID=454 RepID=A0AAX1EIS4_9GAMM|nr:2,3-bisphosphoglycerate-independent phosphoglycerate mutase [Legionella israelensis]QBR85007.1 2,3-bisphosphoglycerate-independent phosphoglycerate mutase [Legionella israelensis]
MPERTPLVLMILDGWGYNENADHNAIHAARTPQWDKWWNTRPHMLLQASGQSVGLPDAQMGNSEVGHMHLGAGRILSQDFTRINQSIRDDRFSENTIFNQTIDHLKETGKSMHVMGLLSPGGVHSHEDHLFAFLDLCAEKQFQSLCLHLFLDGRDTPPQSALQSVHRLNQQLTQLPGAKICSITGRYYAMDRDKRWERIKPAYHLITAAESEHHYPAAEEAIKEYYLSGVSDEFIPPTHINDGTPIKNGDAVFFFNFRADRARQLTSAFIDEEFQGFERKTQPKLSAFISMTQYSKDLNTICAFPPLKMQHTLGEIISEYGLTQLRIAETEKYAHVTFFFNGGTEEVFADEDRILVPSPQVATYDLQPEMSAPELTMALVDAINSQAYDVIICNYANADMVGHSGNFSATVRAIECLDKCMSQVWSALKKHKGQLLITADHGNAETMYDETTHQPHTAHTCMPVPLLYIGHPQWKFTQQNGSLVDVAPSILALLDIEKPAEMTGKALLEKDND